MPKLFEGPLAPVDPVLARRDALLGVNPGPTVPNPDPILARRDALLRPMNRPAVSAGPATEGGPVDEMSPGRLAGGGSAPWHWDTSPQAAQLEAINTQLASIERDIKLREQAREMLMKQRAALSKAKK